MLAAALIGLAALSAPVQNGDLLVTDRTHSHGADDSSWLRRIDPASGHVTRTPICNQRPDGSLFTQPGCSDVGPPAASPDGDSVAFVARDFSYEEPFLPSTWRMRVLSLATGQWRLVPVSGARLQYESIVSWTPSTDFVLTGAGHRILLTGPDGRVSRVVARGTAPDVSAFGVLAFVRRGSVYLRRPDGSARRLAAGHQPAWSPGGSKVAFVRRDWIYTVRAAGGKPRRVARGFHPTWSPDGRQIAFFREVRTGTYVHALTRGTGRVRRVSSEAIVLPDDIQPNGLDWQPAPAR
jgi:Tol biopolymer transport system component